MRKISADYILPVSSPAIKNGVVIIDDQGTILDCLSKNELGTADIESFPGIIIPGFVNTHCHLELSHMKALVDTGTGLIPFISAVVQYRDFPEDQIMSAIENADREMYENGIVAVGDICNKIDTAATKASSKINYYSFVEMFDFMQSNMTAATIEQYSAVFQQQADQGGNKKSMVPHAPYSVSEALFEYIKKHNVADCTVSIHNQETEAENQLFVCGDGPFLDFYNQIGFPLKALKANGKSAIHYATEHMNPDQKNLFVHNTMTTAADIEHAHSWSDQVYWATCPNANLYIENRLPNYQHFISSNAKMTIGTDSLTSNWQLCIWEEIKTIYRHQSFVPIESLIKWATLNGAEALGYDDQLGSITKGKRPGLININIDMDQNKPSLLNSHPTRID